MNQVHVTICVGTACYVLGGAELLGAIDELNHSYGGRVSCEGSPCLGLCKLGRENRAPFAKVNGRLIEAVTVESLKKAVEEALSEDGNG